MYSTTRKAKRKFQDFEEPVDFYQTSKRTTQYHEETTSDQQKFLYQIQLSLDKTPGTNNVFCKLLLNSLVSFAYKMNIKIQQLRKDSNACENAFLIRSDKLSLEKYLSLQFSIPAGLTPTLDFSICSNSEGYILSIEIESMLGIVDTVCTHVIDSKLIENRNLIFTFDKMYEQNFFSNFFFAMLDHAEQACVPTFGSDNFPRD